MPKKGGKRTKTRTHSTGGPDGATVLEEVGNIKEDIPQTIVARSGKVVTLVSELVSDFRKLMGPHTAKSLKEKSYNRLKDYVSVAGQLGVTHLLLLSQTKSNVVLKIGRYPSGPTLHFHVSQYTLCRHIRSNQKHPFDSATAYLTPPLVVLNNFGQDESSQVQLMKVTLQHMFPSINIKTVRLSECRRVVLFHYHKDTGLVELRHYAIRASPVGISRNIKKILQSKIPNLGQLEDVSEFLEQTTGANFFDGNASDSEAEDEASKVTLPERFMGQGNAKTQQSAMKLSELGPRMTLSLFKVEKGLGEGDILYHKYEEKSTEADLASKKKIESQKSLKDERRAVQEANVKRKREEANEKMRVKQEKKRLRIEGNAASSTNTTEPTEEDSGEEGDDDSDMSEDDSDDNEDQSNSEDEEEYSQDEDTDGEQEE